MGIEVLIGQTLRKVEIDKGGSDDEIIFETINGNKYKMCHYQDCCEQVNIEDIVGDIEDLIGTPILKAEELTNNDEHPEGVDKGFGDSFTWTFYHIATIKGSVTIRWYGESNGYYSEDVAFNQC